ncbi:retrovirus-related Pol polyprotein from transposon 17.6 [Trichonephila clavipes]|nr:retrovirus-related Pol polyprotein from transposon 17.6 [Trichonephila clavipes]
MDGSQISCAALRALALNSREQIIREQREDPELGHIYHYLENPDDGSVNATVCKDLLGLYPASRPERYRFLLVITDHFIKWSELIPLRKASAQAIANALFENYISRYEAPIFLISYNGPQFISEVFEHLSHRLDIKYMKTVTYRPQANLTERVNRNLVQMIACFVEENHENWDRFLHEFAFALRTSVNETTNKNPAELFLGRKIITPFSKLINVTENAEYVGRNIEKLFDEAWQNMRKQHKNWGKYYNRKRREVSIKVNDLVLLQTHFISAAGRRVVGKFMPKFEGPYRVLEVRNNNLIIWKKGKRVAELISTRDHSPFQVPLIPEIPDRTSHLQKGADTNDVDNTTRPGRQGQLKMEPTGQLRDLSDLNRRQQTEVILSMDEFNLDQASQDINKEEFQLERACLQAFVAATDPGCKKELIRSGSLVEDSSQKAQEALIATKSERPKQEGIYKSKSRKVDGYKYCKRKGHWVKDSRKWISDGRPSKNKLSDTHSNTLSANIALMSVSEEVCTSEISPTSYWIDNGATREIWAAAFKPSKSQGDEERSGRPNTAATVEHIARVHQMGLDDRQIKVREIAEAMNMSKERVCHLLNQH